MKQFLLCGGLFLSSVALLAQETKVHQIYVITDYGFMNTSYDHKVAQKELSKMCEEQYGGVLDLTSIESVISRQGLATFGQCLVE